MTRRLSQGSLAIPEDKLEHGETVRLETPGAMMVTGGPAAVLAIITQAVEKGASVETVRALQDMLHKEQDRAARLEFAEALARFQAECPPVPADAELGHLMRTDAKGVKRAVRFATIQGLRDWMHPYLASNGFSISFDAETDGDMLTGIATLTHANGHKESSKFRLPTASKTPAMSPQQAYEAAYSFAGRIALRSVTGVRVSADDEKASAEVDPTTISDSQAADLEALCAEVGADPVRFLAFMEAASFSAIRAADHEKAVRALEAKRKRQ